MDNESVSQLWPGWETVKIIGRGSFGAVYEIQREVFGDVEKAALKVISIPQNSSDIDEMYGDGYDDESITSTFQNYLKSIVAEYSLMKKLGSCPHIVNCDDIRYTQHDDGFGWDIFIKMELLTPLKKKFGNGFGEEDAIRLGKDICRALALCEQNHVLHRDIKPENIFVSDYGDYKLGDFGIAKTVEKTMGGTRTGTYKYMAPEVYNNQPYNGTVDIYSLGLVLYWMLNERRTPFMPLPPETPKAGDDEKSRLRRFGGEAIPAPVNGSKELKAIVLKACAFDPKDRYRSAAEMLEALESIGKKAEPKRAPEPVWQPEPRTEPETESKTETMAKHAAEPVSAAKTPPVKPAKKKKPWWIAVAAAVLCAVVLIAGGKKNQEIPATEHTYEPSAENEIPLVHEFSFEVASSISKAVSHTYSDLAVIEADGTVTSVGTNEYGQGDTAEWHDIIQISGGNCHLIGLRKDGTVVSVGDNSAGQTDTSNWKDIVYIDAGQYSSAGVTVSGELVATKDYNERTGRGWTDLVAVSESYYHRAALKADGTVVAGGANDYGQCEVGSWTDIIQVVTGSDYTAGLKKDGTVVTAGDTNAVWVGPFDTSNWTDVIFLCDSLGSLMGIKSDGTVFYAGAENEGFVESDWNDIACVFGGNASYHFIGLKWDGSLVATSWAECVADTVFSQSELEERFLLPGISGNAQSGVAEEKNQSTETLKAYTEFGSYEQDGNTSNGKEKIEWLVLDEEDGKLLLTTKYALAVLPYNTSFEEISWGRSSLRAWLNGKFYKEAFNAEERDAICLTTNKNSFIMEHSFEEDAEVEDNVFLLTRGQVEEYFPESKTAMLPIANVLSNKEYPKTVYNTSKKTIVWWTRSAGSTSFGRNAVVVGVMGSITTEHPVNEERAVRPTIWVDESKIGILN